MKRVIFTTFDDINTSVQTGVFSKGEIAFTQNMDNANSLLVEEYFDRLVLNKKEYADKIGVDFIFYHNEMKDFDIDVGLEFTKVNLWKHHLMANLANEYDEIMYVDMDVLFNTDLNVFEEHDLSKGIHVKDQDEDLINKNKDAIRLKFVGLRSPVLKYFITKDLLDGKDNHVINTGIIIAKSDHIKQIKFIERTYEVLDKISSLKKEQSFINKLYYPNNESIFSYILEKHNVPYVLLDEMWHKRYDEKPATGLEGHCIHFINKQFSRFFKDKTKAIFSMHIDIPDQKLDNPRSYKDNILSKSKIAQMQFQKYEQQLLENHTDYAKAVEAEYLHFSRDEKYEEFYTRFPDLSEYDVVNLYKIYLLEELTKEYDLVMYVDLDVYFANHADIFDTVPADYAICTLYDTKEQLNINHDSEHYFKEYNKDYRNPESKYWNTHALLTEEGFDGENDVHNTGVVIASKRSMEKLDYFSDIEDVITQMKEIKHDDYSMYPPQVRQSFGYDNETIFSYKIKKNNVLNYRLGYWWHLRHYYDNKLSLEPNTYERRVALKKLEVFCIKWNPTIIHFISKNFGLVLDK